MPPKTASELDPEVTQEVFVPRNVTIGTAQNSKVAVGEIRFSRVLQMSSEEDLVQMAGNDVEEALQVAEGEQCERAEALWRQAKLRLTRDSAWAAKATPTVNAALAQCWTVRATRLEDPSAQVPLWEKARIWDRWEPTLLTKRLGAVGYWVQAGQQAQAAEDWETAIRRSQM